MKKRATPVFKTFEELAEYLQPVPGTNGCLKWRYHKRSRYPYIVQPERPHLLVSWSPYFVLGQKLAYDLKHGLPEGRSIRRKTECRFHGCMNPDHYDLW